LDDLLKLKAEVAEDSATAAKKSAKLVSLIVLYVVDKVAIDIQIKCKFKMHGVCGCMEVFEIWHS
jgi:hypothetical protein